MNNKYVSIILFTWFLKYILNVIYVLYFQVFPFKTKYDFVDVASHSY